MQVPVNEVLLYWLSYVGEIRDANTYETPFTTANAIRWLVVWNCTVKYSYILMCHCCVH